MHYIVVSETARSAQELITAAKAQCAQAITAVVFDQADAQVVSSCGSTRVVCVNLDAGAPKDAVCDVVTAIAKDAGQAIVLTTCSRRILNAAGRIAQTLGTTPIVDVSELEDGAATNTLYGGKSLITRKPTGPYGVFALRLGSFEPAEQTEIACPIDQVSVSAPDGVRVRALKPKSDSSVDLTAAKKIVCIGRGVETREDFELCLNLQKALGAEMACSRPVVETANPFLPRERYIGASGVSLKPDLYFGVAVSGQVQHTMGMYESGRVVVINKDKNAVFFRACDYGIVGDFNDIVPAIIEELDA